MKRIVLILFVLLTTISNMNGSVNGMWYLPNGKTRVDKEFGGRDIMGSYKTSLFSLILCDFNRIVCKDSIFIQVRFIFDNKLPVDYLLEYHDKFDNSYRNDDTSGDRYYWSPITQKKVLCLYSSDPNMDLTTSLKILYYGITHKKEILSFQAIDFYQRPLDSLYMMAAIDSKLHEILLQEYPQLDTIWHKRYALGNSHGGNENYFYFNKHWNIYDCNDTQKTLITLSNIIDVETNDSDFVYFIDTNTFYFYSKHKHLFTGPVTYPKLIYGRDANVERILWQDSVVVLRRYDYDLIYNPRTNSVIEDTNSIDFNKLAGLIPVRENLHWQKWHKTEIAKHKRQAFILTLLVLFLNAFLIWRSRK